MARNSNGTFSLAPGNPVVEDTTIDPDWANDTLNDIAAEITDSLSRSGKGGMLVPMEFSDGTVGDPAITFSAAPTTGIYRAGTNDVRFSLAGVDLVQLSATLLKLIARVTDGATAVGLELDTTNALANASAKLLRVLNATVEKFYLDKDANVFGGGLFQALAAVGATLKGNVADGATAVGVILDNVASLANAASKALSVRSAGTERFSVFGAGGIGIHSPEFRVKLSAHEDLEGDLDIILPWDTPASTKPLTMTSAGQILTNGALGAPSAATDAMRYGDSFAAPTIIRPTIAAGWTNGTGDAAFGYWKDRFGVVHLVGNAYWVSGTVTIATLPAGYRPAATRGFAVHAFEGEPLFVTVGDDGDVTAYANNRTFYFDSVSFLAEQ